MNKIFEWGLKSASIFLIILLLFLTVGILKEPVEFSFSGVVLFSAGLGLGLTWGFEKR